MIFKYIFKKPILVIGILMMLAFIMDFYKRGFIFKLWPNTVATSCRSAIVMLEKRMEKFWSAECDDNNLNVTVDFPKEILKKAAHKNLKKLLYRSLANDLSFISKNTLHESLERTDWVTLTQKTPFYTIKAFGKGHDIAKLKNLTNKRFIADHLKRTIKIQETPK